MASGPIIFEGKVLANASIVIPINGWLDGLYITTLDSGKVMVYLDQG